MAPIHHPEELIVLDDRDLDHVLAPWFIGIARGLTAVIHNQKIINRKVDSIMADFTAANAALDALGADDTSIVAELQKLSAEVASGTADQTAVDALTARATQIHADLQAALAAAEPPPVAAPADASTAPDTTGV